MNGVFAALRSLDIRTRFRRARRQPLRGRLRTVARSLTQLFGAVRIGVSIDGNMLHAVELRRGVIGRLIQGELEPNETLENAVDLLLRELRPRRGPAPLMTMAMSEPWVQLRRLRGLPPNGEPRLLARSVAASPNRFFLRGATLRTGGIRPEPGESPWGIAVQESVLLAMHRVAADAGFRLDRITASEVALGYAIGVGDYSAAPDVPIVLRWGIAGGSQELHYVHGRLLSRSVIRSGTDAPASREAEAARPFASDLEKLGREYERFAVAYGAACLPAHEPLVVDVVARGGTAGVPRRLIVAGAVFLMSVTASYIVPALDARRRADGDRIRIAALAPAYATAVASSRELIAVSHALDEIAAFESERRSPLTLLGHIATALPDSAAIVRLAVDDSGTTLTLVSARPEVAADALRRLPSISSVELSGEVTHELIAGQDLQRAVVRLRNNRRPDIGQYAAARPSQTPMRAESTAIAVREERR
jgi:hypothetical protein